MSPRTRRRKPFLIDRTQGLVIAVIQRRMFLMLIVPLLAVGMAVTYLPAGTSHAATTASPSDDGLVWTPGAITQTKSADGGCFVNEVGSVSSADANGETALVNALNDVPERSVNIDGTDSYGLGNVDANTVPGKAVLDCSLINQVAYSFKAQHPGTEPAVFELPRAGFHDAVPAWLKGALGIIATTVVYIAVSAVVIATMVALGAAVTSTGGLASAALGLLAGCIGGAAADAVGLAVAGVNTSPLSIVGETIAGCLTGAALEAIPVHSAGTWIATELGNALGGGAAAVGGTALTDIATTAGVELTPISQALQSAEAALNQL
jgi:hypothetical protein